MSHTVLLIDDEPNALAGLTRVLRKEPYEILTADSAEEAKQKNPRELLDEMEHAPSRKAESCSRASAWWTLPEHSRTA